MKPIQPVARQQMKPLTPEEKKEQLMRAFIQKKASLAEGVLFNLMQNPSLETYCRGVNPAHVANDIADEFMKVVYGQEITYKGTEE